MNSALGLQRDRFSYAVAKRVLDFVLALPIFIVSLIIAAPVAMRRINTPSFDTMSLRLMAGLWKVLSGRMSLVGPRMANSSEFSMEALEARSSVRPGLVCLHWLRKRTNVAYGNELASDLEYIQKRSLRTDLSILALSLLGLVYGHSGKKAERVLHMLGVRIDNLSMQETLVSINKMLDLKGESHQISFVNADCMNKSVTDSEYKQALDSSDLILADGIGLKMAGSILQSPIKENVNGTDLLPRLCELMNERGASLFLLGARPDVIEAVSERIQREYPHIRVSGAQHGYFKNEAEVVNNISAAAPDVLLVAMGAPFQELFISKNLHSMNTKLSIGVGGLFDFYSGRIPRAPQWMRDAGLEWTFRLYQEPNRMWKRYLVGNLVFLTRVLVSKFKLHKIEHTKVAVS